VAPSAPVDRDRLERGTRLLASWGLQVRLGEHVLARAHDGMLAGTDEQRAADLVDAWTDPDVRAVLAARGGYGATRLLPLIDWEAMSGVAPRWLIGSSDVTALHAAFARRLGVQTLHGPMPASELLAGEDPDATSTQALHRLLFGAADLAGTVHGDPSWSLTGPGGVVTAPLTGGNLALLTTLAGTADLPEASGHVVLLEDVDEPPYKVDRMLTHLRAVGWFDAVAGIAIGAFVRCGSPGVLRRVVVDRLGDLGVAIVGGLPLGHGRPQESVVLGGDVALDAAAATLSWGSAVASRRSSST
jgi:muramoyltetrapeptide carboxypeptidase